MSATQKAREAARKAYDEVSGNPTCDDPIGVAVDAALAVLDAETGDDPSKAFARWLEEGPRLAKAAGCYVGIKVTESRS